MSDFKMKCPECLYEFSGGTENAYIVCPNCNKEINVNQAIKYYQSLKRIENDDRKVAAGEKYKQLNTLLDECQWLIDNGDYNSALNTTDLALKLSNTDGRVYQLRVLAKTKNFTDFEETSHFSDLKKALEYSSTLEKEAIKRAYSPYHKKRSIPKEELDEYENQEAGSKLKKVEGLLKDGIPKHFSREKSIKVLTAVISALAVAFIVLLILSISLDNIILTLTTAVAFTLFFIFFAVLTTNVKKVKLYNSVLDIYDNLKTFNLSPRAKLNLSKSLEKFTVSFLNGESITHIETSLYQMVEALLDSETALDYIKNDKTLKKFL